MWKWMISCLFGCNVGPEANRIEQDFDRLLNGKEIGRPSIDIPGVLNPPKRKTKLPYRTCSSRRPSQQLTNQLGIGMLKTRILPNQGNFLYISLTWKKYIQQWTRTIILSKQIKPWLQKCNTNTAEIHWKAGRTRMNLHKIYIYIYLCPTFFLSDSSIRTSGVPDRLSTHMSTLCGILVTLVISTFLTTELRSS